MVTLIIISRNPDYDNTSTNDNSCTIKIDTLHTPATALTDVVSEVIVRVVLLLDLLALNAVDEDWSVALRPLRNVNHSD